MSKTDFFNAVGRRKTSAARVRLHKGAGQSTVNDMPIEEYFPGDSMKAVYLAPLFVTDMADKYHITVKVEGGGIWSQANAVAHGLARAVIKMDDSLKALLRAAGLVTRDSRMKERRKPGLAQSARAKKSSPKR